jgi:myosin heavy subunit
LQRLYNEEGLLFPDVEVLNNDPVLQELEENPNGVLSLLNARSWMLTDNGADAVVGDLRTKLVSVFSLYFLPSFLSVPFPFAPFL